MQLAPIANIGYSSIKADLFTATLSINDLTIQLQPDTTDRSRQHLLRFSTGELTGINFLKVVFKKKLAVNTLQLTNGNIRLDQSLFDKTRMLQNELSARMPFKAISINRFQVTTSAIWLHANNRMAPFTF